MSGQAMATVQIETERFRVIRYDLEPGDRIPWHRHEYDYVAVPLTDGAVEIRTAEGSSAQRMTAGTPYARSAGAEHELVNGSEPYSFVEVERF